MQKEMAKLCGQDAEVQAAQDAPYSLLDAEAKRRADVQSSGEGDEIGRDHAKKLSFSGRPRQGFGKRDQEHRAERRDLVKADESALKYTGPRGEGRAR